jgi:hypothetical protein
MGNRPNGEAGEMSDHIVGGINVGLMKRHYNSNDYPSLFVNGVNVLNGIPFTDAPTFYVSGLCAFLNNPNVFNVEPKYGWTFYATGQNAAPAYLAAAGVNWRQIVSGYPDVVPSFEAKDTLFWSDEDCWIQFGNDPSNVRHFIPAETFMRFHEKWYMLWVTRATADGTLFIWIEG